MNNRTRVLVVDDSAFVVTAVTRKLNADPNLEVIGSARNGVEAIEKVKKLKPDVVTMDVVMPEMDGLTALGNIMSQCPTPVVMLSALTDEGADSTIKALALGAVDFFLKPSALNPAGGNDNGRELIDKIKLAAVARIPGRKTASKPNPTPVKPKKRIKVLVVDDSCFVRNAVSNKVSADQEIEVVGVASNGEEAVQKVKSLKPDVVTMDVIMPQMDGLTALEKIMSESPTAVIMLSALTGEGSESAVKALELGAIDFFLKPSILNPMGDTQMQGTLIEKIKLASTAKLLKSRKPAALNPAGLKKSKPSASTPTQVQNVIVIGSSTGGPKALMQVIPFIPEDIPAPILIVQHMPPLFTKSLAERLDQSSKISVREAQQGDSVVIGEVLLAPGDFHMTVVKDGRIKLNQEPTVHGVRPAVDVLMKSTSKIYGNANIGVVLTGMGSDGTDGASYIKAVGGKVLVEHESTCAVYGMPMSIVKAGYADKIVPLPQVAQEIVRSCKRKQNIKREA